MRGIYWLRGDLRFHDNPALLSFCQECESGAFVFSLSPSQKRAGPFRLQFLLETLHSFNEKLKSHGQQIYWAEGPPQKWLNNLEGNFKVFFSQEICTEEKEEEQFPHPSQSYFSQLLLDSYPSPLPPTFTSFRKAVEPVKVSVPLAGPTKLPKALALNLSPLPPLLPKIPSPFQGGEESGLARARHYILESKKIRTYKETRNGMLEFDESSKLSPWLAVGAISARQVQAFIKQHESEWGANESTYWLTFELLWRDYFKILALQMGASFFPRTKLGSSPIFEQWKEGRTENAFINANMRELLRTGWMSNRGRQNVASYWAKTLSQDYALGASWFETQLLDYDPALTWGNWAYLAGTGTDPRDRKFNPERQASLYDPEGLYKKRWLNV